MGCANSTEATGPAAGTKVGGKTGGQRRLLVVKSSLSGDNGQSNKLMKAFVASWTKKHSGQVVERDVDATPLPHLEQAEMAAWMAADRTPAQKKLAALSDSLIDEFKSADDIVVGVPMYNFWIPSTLKAWIDRLLRAGVTFKYTATGPAALVDGKKMYFLCSRGGVYAGTENDVQTPYLKQTFGFIGQTDLTFVYAEGFAMGAEGAEKAAKAAEQKISELFVK